MPDNLVSIIMPLVSTLIGVGVGAVLTYFVMSRIERRKLLLEKCELIYTLAIQVKQWHENENNLWWNRVYPNDIPDLPYTQDLTCPIEELLMLVDLIVLKDRRGVELKIKALALNKFVRELQGREYDYRENGKIIFSRYHESMDDVLRRESKEIDALYEELVASIKEQIRRS